MSTKCVQGVTLDLTPRIMYWYGKVNQHVDNTGAWQTDTDGVSGANLDKLSYCKKWYPDLNIVAIEDYKNETIDTWRAAGNTGAYNSTKMSTKCVQGIILPPINGGWSVWENSGSCINSKQTQIRSCNNPSLANGGNDCMGSPVQEISCTVIVPVDGGWSTWKNLGTCFNGIQSQSRTCTNPSPANGGAICVGDSIQNISCSTVIPINGGWSSWRNSGRCINGNQAQIRTCNNPIPKNGGDMCVGDSSRNISCTLVSPINGGWGPWENLNSCINNKQKQIRLCNNPSPANGGDTCSGASIQEVDCVSTAPQEDLIDEDLNLVDVSFYRDLILGRSGDDVKLLQKILRDKGYDIGRIDGIYGEKTRNAVTLYQTNNGLKVSGFIDNDDVLDRVRFELLNVD